LKYSIISDIFEATHIILMMTNIIITNSCSSALLENHLNLLLIIIN